MDLPLIQASPTPANDPYAVLQAPDLDSAERAYLGLLPDRAHVDALARQAASRAGQSPGRDYALTLTLLGMRLQEFKMGEDCAASCRQQTLQAFRQAFAVG